MGGTFVAVAELAVFVGSGAVVTAGAMVDVGESPKGVLREGVLTAPQAARRIITSKKNPARLLFIVIFTSNDSIIHAEFSNQVEQGKMDAMPYLIDGHNLIPKLGLRLDSPDDEMQLVGVLQEFCRLQRRDAEVYFDGAPVGQDRTQKFGIVTAHFVRLGTTADSAIKIRLGKMGRAARNWVVVSSDHAVQNSARTVHADVISSNKFAELLKKASPLQSKLDTESKLSSEEVEEWLKLFGRKK